MPFTRFEAMGFRASIATRSLWCGHWLGGCGTQLTTRIGMEKVPHFAHYPDSTGRQRSCHRANNDLSSADHLFVNRGMTELLNRAGHRPSQPLFEGDFETGGSCHRLTIQVPDVDGKIIVAFRGADLSTWEKDDERLRSSSSWVTWMFGQGLRAPAPLLRRDGLAFHLMLDDRRPGRAVLIGTQRVAYPTEWISLETCSITSRGLGTPSSSQTERERVLLSEQAPPPKPEDPPEPVSKTVMVANDIELTVDELRHLLARIAQRYGFLDDQRRSAECATLARELKTDPPKHLALPNWLNTDIRALSGNGRLPERRTARLLDPDETLDELDLPLPLVSLLSELGWNPRGDVGRERWLKLARMHRSFLYETSRRIDPKIPNILEEVGKRWLQLALLDKYSVSFRAKKAGEQSSAHAQLRPKLVEQVAALPEISSACLFGRGEETAQGATGRGRSRARIAVALQILGAVALNEGIGAIYSLVERIYPFIIDTLTTSTDWRTLLQEQATGITFTYERTGADHEALFWARASDAVGRSGEGAAPSKKAAAQAASENFIRRHLPKALTALTTSQHPRAGARSRPLCYSTRHTDHWRAVATARALFSLPPEAEPDLNQALTHSSWAYENQNEVSAVRQQDNAVLAHHGSVVVDTLVCHRRAQQTLSATMTPQGDQAVFKTPMELLWRDAFMKSPLMPGILLSRGQQANPVPAYANAMQAVIAVAWRLRGYELFRSLPAFLEDSVRDAVDAYRDHHTLLNQVCAGFGLELSDQYEVRGPDHDRRYFCQITISSGDGEKVVISGAQPGRGKSSAKQAAAEFVLDVLERITQSDDWDLAENQREIAVFLLRHQLNRVGRLGEREIARLANHGVLGAMHVLTDDVAAVAAWAQQIEDLIGGITPETSEDLRRYYVRCLDVTRSSRPKPLHSLLQNICDATLDADRPDSGASTETAERVIWASLSEVEKEARGLSELLRWIFSVANDDGEHVLVRPLDDGFSVSLPKIDQSSRITSFYELMSAQIPSIRMTIDEQALTLTTQPPMVARSILQAAALALEDARMNVSTSLCSDVQELMRAQMSDDWEAAVATAKRIRSRWL